MKGLVRSARFEDGLAASAFLAGLGLVQPEGEAARLRHWDHLWRQNPALKRGGERADLGWLIEDAGQIVGFFGNVPRIYRLGERRLVAGCATQWGVDPLWRTETRRLAKAYAEQGKVDVLLVTTAKRAASRLFLENGYVAVPQGGLDSVLFWVADSRGFLEAAMRRKRWPLVLADLGTPPLALHGFLTRRFHKPLAVERIGRQALDEDFDIFFERVCATRPQCLLAERDGETLRWSYPEPERVEFLVVREMGRLRGFLALFNDDAPAIGLKRRKVIDLLAGNDDDDVIDSLLAAAFERTRETGAHLVELVGLPREVRARAKLAGALARRFISWPAYYKPLAEGLALDSESAWYLSGLDGDATLV
ncbi:MAG: hypothetical protein IT565_11550 [Rhodospirillales bacterium]|nr:hypothetical protein [Rhodospirillales bacterium]